jgi:hypothetical protein
MKKRSGGKAHQKRIADAAAKKKRRQTVIAIGGLVVLAVLMFFQGPKILKGFRGPDTLTPVAVAATPVSTDHNKGYRALRLLKANGGDPFARRALGDNDPQAGSVPGPEGTRDPFVPDSGSGPVSPTPATPATPAPAPAPTPTPSVTPVAVPLPVVGTPRPGAFARPGWIVVLASIETRRGRAYAESFARTARRKGIGVSVLDSSTRRPLRAGYYVVYTGPFASLPAVQRSAARVHAFGYPTAYVRQILRY